MSIFDTLLYGRSPQLLEAINTASIIASTDITTLIYGDSGTGKELIARGIHLSSTRSNAPFISINCASLPDSLAESLLFGHKKGAFTNATSDHLGYIRSANEGTLFLDEIAELPLKTQAKLLRFLESGECHTVGDVTTYTPDVRILAATNRDLLSEVKEQRFREDLYYRLNVVSVSMPSLRERRRDIPLLLRHFTKESAERFARTPPDYSKATLKLLQAYHWPGNVRELRNLAERMVILVAGQTVYPQNLPADITNNARSEFTGSRYHLPPEGIKFNEFEADIIAQALHQANGNQSKAARLLGLTRDTLIYRIKKYAIG